MLKINIVYINNNITYHYYISQKHKLGLFNLPQNIFIDILFNIFASPRSINFCYFDRIQSLHRNTSHRLSNVMKKLQNYREPSIDENMGRRHGARNNADRKRVILLELERKRRRKRRRRRRRRRRRTSPDAARLGKIQRRTTFLFILHPRMWTLNDIELFMRDRLFAFLPHNFFSLLLPDNAFSFNISSLASSVFLFTLN